MSGLDRPKPGRAQEVRCRAIIGVFTIVVTHLVCSCAEAAPRPALVEASTPPMGEGLLVRGFVTIFYNPR